VATDDECNYRWIKHFAEKITAKFFMPIERDGSPAYCNATQYGIDIVTG